MPQGKRAVPGSGANYWQLSVEMLNNAQVVVHPLDRAIEVPKEPHWYLEGSVQEVLAEADGDRHLWLVPAGSHKDRIACEFTPQQREDAYPKVGDGIRVYGILRYDLQHGWWEIHPVDFWEHL